MVYPLHTTQRAKKYRSILKDLQYVTYYSLMTYGYLPNNLIEKLSEVTEDYSAPAFRHDELALFIKMINVSLNIQ